MMTYAQAVVAALPAPPVHEFWAWSNGTPTTREDVYEAAARDGVEVTRRAAWRLAYGTMNVLHVVRHSPAVGMAVFDRGAGSPAARVRH